MFLSGGSGVAMLLLLLFYAGNNSPALLSCLTCHQVNESHTVLGIYNDIETSNKSISNWPAKI